MEEKVLFVDLMNLFVRNFSVIPMMNSNGDHVGGLYGTLNSLRKYVTMFQPSQIIIAWEGKNSAKRRRAISPTYKGGRKFTGLNRAFEGDVEREKVSFQEQLLKLTEYFKVLPFQQVMVDYLEADDVIGWLSRSHVFKGKQKIVISLDRDFLQLIDHETKVYRPIKTKKDPDGEIIDVQWMKENYKCWPENYILIKSITGDVSDKIVGVSGVGQKTVNKDFPFLEEQKTFTIDDLIGYCSENNNKQYSKYLKEENIETMKQNVKLVQLTKPNISIHSVNEIEKKLKTKNSFDKLKFRMLLMKDEVSSSNVNKWSMEFSQVKV